MTPTGSTWIIGDIQGCCQPLSQLLRHADIASDPNAQFWFAGDLVNRGPNSLETLNLIRAMGERCVAILGNHDLHLLAVAAGVKKPGKSDTITDILNAPNANELIDWLRHRPLAYHALNHLMVHAGIPVGWNVEKTLQLAAEAEAALRSPNWKSNLEKMYGNEPAYWSDDLRGNDRLRVTINALTRMRMCTAQGHMDFEYKRAPAPDEHLMPWFDVPGRTILEDNVTVVFGHWSTLGLMIRQDAICLDTGCIWGKQLTAMRVHDHKLVQMDCVQQRQPKSPWIPPKLA